MTFYAHSENEVGNWHPLKAHLSSVSKLAGEFAGDWLGSEEAELAGLLHDLGKYGDRFQRRLQGKERGLDHWSQGAWLAATEYQGLSAALAIQGHHIGLQKPQADEMNPAELAEYHPWNLCLSDEDLVRLLKRFQSDGLSVEAVKKPAVAQGFERLDSMLDVRRVFSALVDADFLDTEAHFNSNEAGKRYRLFSPELQPAKALQILEDHLQQLNQSKQHANDTDDELLHLREDLKTICLQAAKQATGLFTLTAPTGSGKTLSMLAFALKHAAQNNLRRVIMVIPYLSIIEQTARVYRELFEPHFGEHYVLEHHSLVGTGSNETKQDGDDNAPEDEDGERRRRLQAENWDAPLVITTSVQALESLFANRPAACRKLHRMAESVILFDEVQTLPVNVIVPTLGALSHIANQWRSSVVFATATQPAFEHLADAVKTHSEAGWQPKNIQPTVTLKPRVDYQWPDADEEALSWEAVADQLVQESQVLCIVNLKRHAQALIASLDAVGVEGVFHLSTNLCAAHRTDVLKTVKKRLANQQSCRLISTQCIEAGVDIDFPAVWRAMGPLDAIIQAAGRCNRHGIRPEPGRVRIFLPEEDGCPPGAYAQATAMTKILLEEVSQNLDLHNVAVIQQYYQRLYDITDPENQSPELLRAIESADFPKVAAEYKIIEQNTINVLVCYAEHAAEFEQLKAAVNEHGLKRDWIKQARPYTVSLYRPKQGDTVWHNLLPVNQLKQGRWQTTEDWFVAELRHYDKQLGLTLPNDMDVCIG